MTFEVQLREILEQDEARVGEIYLCSESVPTLGIGHAVTVDDPEYGLPVGTAISDARIDAAFAADMERCLTDARWLVPKFDDLPDDARITIASLAFQLGMPRYSRFKLHLAAINADQVDWQAAADELRDSKLYRQTPARTERHAQRLEQLST
nr:Phage-related lysozyme (muraminidase) (COG3772) [uncultured Mediterranean phage uvMED]